MILNIKNIKYLLFILIVYIFIFFLYIDLWEINSLKSLYFASVSYNSKKVDLSCPQDQLNLQDVRHLECFKRQNVKSIQLLTDIFNRFEQLNITDGREMFKECPEKRCSAFRFAPNPPKALENSDGVFVHSLNLARLPRRKYYKRNPRQLWMFYSEESPRHSFCLAKYKLTDLDDWFNLTLTAKSDFSYFAFDLKNLHRYEDYIIAYRHYRKSLSPLELGLEKQTEPKKLAVWFVSHCNTPGKRELFVKELQRYMPIDIFGNCSFSNSKPDPCHDKLNYEECTQELLARYKFYLSFENTLCDSYITEKYFKFYDRRAIFNVDLVPVVRGARLGDYLKRAPSPHSFIDANSFPTTLALADYLLYLDNNETAYQEYLDWKWELKEKIKNHLKKNQTENDEPLLQPKYNDPLCDLCEKLHDEAFLSDTNKPAIKISEIYNPARDCRRDEPYHSEEDLNRRLKFSCLFADRSLFSWHTFLKFFYFKVFSY